VRDITDVLGLTSIATLYQAGNAIYHMFDKVLVLDDGEQIYYGPTSAARPFMESLGFACQDGANVADFLTGVTVPTERRIRQGHELSFPRTPANVEAEYEKSPIFAQMQAEYDYPWSEQAKENTRLFKQAIAAEKHGHLPDSSPLTVSFPTQIKACVIRQYQIVWGDKRAFILKQFITVVQALVMGSLFYDAPDNSAGIFVKSGALFFSLLYNALLSMTEVTDAFSGRQVLVKHGLFAFHHPAAFCIAQITTDLPLVLVQVSAFALILYFLVGFTMSASSFFTFWITLVVTTMVSFSWQAMI
jgi:ABC-type multidrug transport system permease subunit